MARFSVVAMIQSAIRGDIRGSWRLYRFLAARSKSFKRAPVYAFSDSPILLDVSLQTSWAFDQTRAELQNRESALTVVIRELVLPSSVVYDIGANIGVCSDLLRTIVTTAGAVEAFEPNPALVPALIETFANDPQVRIHGVGLAESMGELPFFVPCEESMGSLGRWKIDDPSLRTISVRVARLDDLVRSVGLRHPDFMKVDVEGAEARVFAGAPQVLNREDAPIVWFENLPAAAIAQGLHRDSAMDVLRSFSRAAFSFWAVDELQGLAELTSPPDEWCDLMAVPQSRSEAIHRVATRLVAKRGSTSIGPS